MLATTPQRDQIKRDFGNVKSGRKAGDSAARDLSSHRGRAYPFTRLMARKYQEADVDFISIVRS